LEVFVLSPFRFGVVSFFNGGLYFEPIAFWGCLFFIGCFCFEPMNEGCNNAHSFVAWAYLSYQLLSNTELTLLAILTMVINILGNDAYIIASGLHGLLLITPSWASPVRKRVWALGK
jgi:hypothetical protein